jgi:hypothetical protein
MYLLLVAFLIGDARRGQPRRSCVAYFVVFTSSLKSREELNMRSILGLVVTVVVIVIVLRFLGVI